MNKTIKNDETYYLFRAVLSLKTIDECYNFFEDLCTFNEISAMAQRINVARLLSGGETQTEIIKKTGASSATISRVNRALIYGKDGYRAAFERIDGHRP